MQEVPIFGYAQGDSFLHRTDAALKILFVPLFNVALFLLDWRVSVFFIAFFLVLFLFLKIPLRSQVLDLRPVLYYALFLYATNFCVKFFSFCPGVFFSPDGAFQFGSVKEFFGRIFLLARQAFVSSLLDFDTLAFSLRFCACVQSCLVLFKTSTSVEIRYGIEKIERFVRRLVPWAEKRAKFALAVSMLLIFIPTVFRIWGQLHRAWLARGGRNSLSMVMRLVPQLFSVGLRFAFDSTRSLLNRGWE